MARNTSIFPGKVWLDTEGKRIHAHGGSVFYENGTYYWYGENKEHTNGWDGVCHWGMRCYASRDLYNWEDKGLIIPPVCDDKNSTLHPKSKAERPHIVYNPNTLKYVCWIKVMFPDDTQRSTILQANQFLGPYEIVREQVMPFGMSAGDFDLQVDETTGKAYYIFEKVHTKTIIAELTEDYLDVSEYYTEHFKNGYPPYVREATSHFIRNGKHYLLTSGTTGYYPNPSELAIADDWHGSYTILENPHPMDTSNTSFHSQISCVFKVVEKKDLYIACGDRWLSNQMFLPYEMYAECFEKTYNPSSIEPADWSNISRMLKEHGVDEPPKANTSISDYVWLPLRFDGEMAYIDWKDEWKIEDYV